MKRRTYAKRRPVIRHCRECELPMAICACDEAAEYDAANPIIVCPAPRQEADEYVCVKCAIRWDTHEDKPPCRG